MDPTALFTDALRAAISPTAAAYALAAIGLNLQFGYAGLVNLGFAGTMAAGAYGLAIVVVSGGPFWAGIVVGAATAAVFSLLVALPTVRLRADYLAMTTIATAEILRLILRSSWARPVTGGVNGLQRFANEFYALSPFGTRSFAIGPVIVPGRTLWLIVVAWALVAIVAVVIGAIVRSPWGRTVVAIRQDEDLARALGKNTFAIKVQVMVVGGVCAALAGSVLVTDQQNANPDNFGTPLTFMLYAIVILGGAGRILAPIAGAILFWVLLSVTDGILRALADASTAAGGWFGQDQAGAARYILVGVGLVLVIVFRPQGLLARAARRPSGATA
ncbi:branched-chain amino acid ABC transporter permease [Microbacterium ulmi]|uniref:Branched-chain amino acid ABC transporter permease n=1 Tax=Microbacterium ulmi TaxID=179095 RepID=A0A7Y2LZ52_9MICO|nr:branched-chain amino acid ABC transporter permease [Microbacterium ulmi]NII68428.1 branched-chain amino acid transport system permease protein [Microbacterium ulmi]NNH03049.1 branched-chain amino acid ABC transporter permease [Microbacterium ulmi]